MLAWRTWALRSMCASSAVSSSCWKALMKVRMFSTIRFLLGQYPGQEAAVSEALVEQPQTEQPQAPWHLDLPKGRLADRDPLSGTRVLRK
jgi:hypothetical protein